jgi:hypothetical protein
LADCIEACNVISFAAIFIRDSSGEKFTCHDVPPSVLFKSDIPGLFLFLLWPCGDKPKTGINVPVVWVEHSGCIMPS